jgi:hypothetical protein
LAFVCRLRISLHNDDDDINVALSLKTTLKLTLAHTSIELKTEAAEWAVEEEEGVFAMKALPIQ